MKKAENDPWMPAPDYGHSLKGMGVNLLVRDAQESLAFFTEVLGVELVYGDVDFAVLRHGGQEWMLHSDHTYHSNPVLALTGDGAIRGAGAEFRLYDIDPDKAEGRARAAGVHPRAHREVAPAGHRGRHAHASVWRACTPPEARASETSEFPQDNAKDRPDRRR